MPVPLARLVGKMLKKSRHERPASYTELIVQIETVWAQLAPLSFNPEAYALPANPDPDTTLLDANVGRVSPRAGGLAPAGGDTGPTPQRALFSVWETRVQDYEVFAKETMRGWPKAGDAEQGPTHPAVIVSWEDVVAFLRVAHGAGAEGGAAGGEGGLSAAELSRVELRGGHRGPGGRGEDAVEKECHNRKDVFVGTQWPPPEGAGNYWSEELRPLIAVGKAGVTKDELPGYHDGFATAAPVGSYAASASASSTSAAMSWNGARTWLLRRRSERLRAMPETSLLML